MSELLKPKYIDGRKLWKKFDEAGFFVDREDRDIAQQAVEDAKEEIIYCDECKYSRPIDRKKAPEKYYRDGCVVCECEDVIGDEGMVYLPNHFCSYGRKKD